MDLRQGMAVAHSADPVLWIGGTYTRRLGKATGETLRPDLYGKHVGSSGVPAQRLGANRGRLRPWGICGFSRYARDHSVLWVESVIRLRDENGLTKAMITLAYGDQPTPVWTMLR